MNGDDLIKALATDLRPIRPVTPPHVAMLIWIAGAALILAAGIGVSHVRSDLLQTLSRPDTAAEAAIAATTALLSAFAAFQRAIPGRAPLWALPPVLGAIAWLALLGFGCLRDLAVLGLLTVDNEMSPTCLIFIAGFGTPVLLMTLALARHALPLNPLPVVLLAALAAAASADLGLVAIDHPHAAATTLIWHGGAGLFLAAMAVMAGPWWMRRAARWFGLARYR